MSIYDLRCDRCGRLLAGPSVSDLDDPRHGVRFVYHPARPDLKDDTGLLCRPCWSETGNWLGDAGLGARCARCGTALDGHPRLVLALVGDLVPWHLCGPHAVEFLNGLRTVEPKLDPATFRLPDPAAT